MLQLLNSEGTVTVFGNFLHYAICKCYAEISEGLLLNFLGATPQDYASNLLASYVLSSGYNITKILPGVPFHGVVKER